VCLFFVAFVQDGVPRRVNIQMNLIFYPLAFRYLCMRIFVCKGRKNRVNIDEKGCNKYGKISDCALQTLSAA
jgi:hypothetical protein